MAPFIRAPALDPILVAPVDAPPSIRAQARFRASGVNDEVILQAAVGLAGPYTAKGTGVKIECAPGRFSLSAPVLLAGHITITGSNMGATMFSLAEGANCDLFQHTPASMELGVSFERVTLNGNYYWSGGDTAGQLNCFDRITGQVKGANTSATGRLYLTITDEGGGNRSIQFYKANSPRDATTLVAHTASYNSTGLKAVVPDGASGLGGFIGVLVVGPATTGIYLWGNWLGRGLYASANSSEGRLSDVEFMHFASHGVEIGEGYCWEIDRAFMNACYGFGGKITGGTAARITRSQFTNNVSGGLYLAAGNSVVSDTHVSAGMYQHQTGTTFLGQQGKSGIENANTGNKLTTIMCENIRTGNYGIYSANANDTLLTSVHCDAVTGATSATGVYVSGVGSRVVQWLSKNLNIGVYLAGSDNYAECGKAEACAIGVAFAGGKSQAIGNALKTCTKGVSSSSGDDNLVATNTFDACTTAIDLGAACDRWNIGVNTILGGGTGIALAAGAGANGASLISGNRLSGQTVAAVADASSAAGLNHFRRNDGCANYDAGRLIAVSADLDMGAAGGEVYRDQTLVFATADKTATLPAATGSRRRYPFARGIKEGSGTATVALPAGAHFVRLGGSVGGDNKALINTAGTSKCGDTLVIEDVAANTYNVAAQIGTWDLQA